MLLGTALSHVPYSSVVALLTSLVHLLRRASASVAPIGPVVFAVSAVSVGVLPELGIVLIVVLLAVEPLLVCSASVG